MDNMSQTSRLWEMARNQSALLSMITFFLALLLGIVIGSFNSIYGAAVIGCLIFAFIILFRLNELAVTLVIAVHLYIDFYLGLHLLGILMALVLLCTCYFRRSHGHPFVEARSLWLWILFLILTVYPSIKGAGVLYDLSSYYPSDVLGAFLMFWLGNIIAKDLSALRHIFQSLSVLVTLVAVHTIIQTVTGTFLFESSRASMLLASVENYQVFGTDAFRSGSFFVDPNWNGTFLVTMFFIPFGLFIESKGFRAKIVFLVEAFVILLALIFTYSLGAWLAMVSGVFTFIIFIGSTRYRVWLLAFIAVLVTIAFIFFPSQLAVGQMRAANPNELSLRQGAWQTGVRVIEAYPLFGVGLSDATYLVRADPYRAPEQYKPLSHPHNTYIQWGAMAGVPVLILFLLLLGSALWFSWHNWLAIDTSYRPLIAGGISALIALSVNSWSINGWTQFVIATVGWLIAGSIASPLLAPSALTVKALS